MMHDMEVDEGADEGVDDPSFDSKALVLYARNTSSSDPPSSATLRRLCREESQVWVDQRGIPTPRDLFDFVGRRLGFGYDEERAVYAEPLDVASDRYTKVFDLITSTKLYLCDLHFCVRQKVVQTSAEKWSGEVEMLRRTCTIVNSTEASFQAFAHLHKSITMKASFCAGNEEAIMAWASRQGVDEVFFNPDLEKLDNFQKVFNHLRSILETAGLRRANGKFFSRVMTRVGFRTFAFEECMTTDEFVNRHTSYTVNFHIWKLATKPMCILRQVAEYLSERDVPEAPLLEVNHHYRSYEGDDYGRDSGVYDCANDMFWPYDAQDIWANMAEQLTRDRAILGIKSAVVSPPPESAVCIVHLDCPFRFSTFAETTELADVRRRGNVRFREAFAFECEVFPYPEKGRPRHGGRMVDAPFLADILDARLSVSRDGSDGYVVGRRWYAWVDPHREMYGESFSGSGYLLSEEEKREIANYYDALPDDAMYASKTFECPLRGWSSRSADRVPEGKLHPDYFFRDRSNTARVFLPTVEVQMRDRVELGIDELVRKEEEWLARGGGSLQGEERVRVADMVVLPCDTNLYVKSDSTERYYVVDTGRTWADVETRELDQIFLCQKFCPYDRFFLYSLLGRLMFHVFERDRHQLTLFIEGYGGCGKSTIMNAQMAFFPPHLRGILSSNMEPLFGMSQVMLEGKAEVILCNEVATNLSIKQEEWQTSVSGEWGSYAVKNGKPLVAVCKAQHFWIGNSRPGFKNGQMQMSRRLAAVLMPFPVQPRDNSIASTIRLKLGNLQRREILAYDLFVRQTGQTDPNSVTHLLPPAFLDYFERCRRETDPIHDFLVSGKYVKKEVGGVMEMKTFRSLYDQYREANDIPKPARWSDKLYDSLFKENGFFVSRPPTVVVNGMTLHRVEVICNMVEVEEEDGDWE